MTGDDYGSRWLETTEEKFNVQEVTETEAWGWLDHLARCKQQQ